MSISTQGAARQAASQITSTHIADVAGRFVTWIDGKAVTPAATEALLAASAQSNVEARVLAIADVYYTELAAFPSSIESTQTYEDGTDLTFGTVTGSKIGTAATQKLAFYGSTPVVKPAALPASVAAAPAGGVGAAAGGWDTAANRDLAIATINNLKTRLDDLETRLKGLGLLS